MKPIRIQRKRTKGWKMPDNTVYVGRPSKWGNPVSIERGEDGWWLYNDDNEAMYWASDKMEAIGYAVDEFRDYAKGFPSKDLDELRGKNLACWCAVGQPCHADVLLERANKEEP